MACADEPERKILMTWTHEDQEAAMEQGWLIADNSDHGLRIERYDDAQRFDSDAAAVAYVGRRAGLGAPLARRAFEHLSWYHAVEDAAQESWV